MRSLADRLIIFSDRENSVVVLELWKNEVDIWIR